MGDHIGNYSKGARFEREVVKEFELNGSYCIRSAGSKGIVDVVAFKRFSGKTYIYLIQCKYGNARMNKEDKEKLIDLAFNLNCIPLYVYRKKNQKKIIKKNLFSEKTEG